MLTAGAAVTSSGRSCRSLVWLAALVGCAAALAFAVAFGPVSSVAANSGGSSSNLAGGGGSNITSSAVQQQSAATASASPSLSPSVQASPSVSPSVQASPSLSPSVQASPSLSPSSSVSPGLVPSNSGSPSVTSSPSVSRSNEATSSLSASASRSPDASSSTSATATPTPSYSAQAAIDPAWGQASISVAHPQLAVASEDGAVILVCLGPNGGDALASRVSSDRGLTWRVAQACEEAASTADGGKLMTMYSSPGNDLSNVLYTSNDRGVTWTSATLAPPAGQWTDMTLSADGNTLALVSWDNTVGGSVFLGRGGATPAAMALQPPAAGAKFNVYNALAVSSDGERIVVSGRDAAGGVWYLFAFAPPSSGGAAVWTARVNKPNPFFHVEWCFGPVDAIVAAGDGLHVSYGPSLETWHEALSSSTLGAAGCGSVRRGAHLHTLVGVNGAGVFTSEDGGATALVDASGATGNAVSWPAVRVSGDGTRRFGLSLDNPGSGAGRLLLSPPQPGATTPSLRSSWRVFGNAGAYTGMEISVHTFGTDSAFICYRASASTPIGAFIYDSRFTAGYRSAFPGVLSHCAVSGDRTSALVVLSDQYNNLYVSTNGGASFPQVATAVPATGSAWAGVASNVDGTIIAAIDAFSTGDGGGRVYRWATGDAALTALASQPGIVTGQYRSLALSPDGSRIVVAAGGTLLLYGTTAGSPSQAVWQIAAGGASGLATPFYAVAWCPTSDSSTLVIAAGEGVWRSTASDARTWSQVLTGSFGSAGPAHTISPQTATSTPFRSVACGDSVVYAGDDAVTGRTTTALWRSTTRGTAGSWETLYARAADGLREAPSTGSSVGGWHTVAVSPNGGFALAASASLSTFYTP